MEPPASSPQAPRFAVRHGEGTAPAPPGDGRISGTASSALPQDAIAKLGVERSLYEILQGLSISLFEKTPLLQALQAKIATSEQDVDHKQLSLFDL